MFSTMAGTQQARSRSGFLNQSTFRLFICPSMYPSVYLFTTFSFFSFFFCQALMPGDQGFSTLALLTSGAGLLSVAGVALCTVGC